MRYFKCLKNDERYRKNVIYPETSILNLKASEFKEVFITEKNKKAFPREMLVSDNCGNCNWVKSMVYGEIEGRFMTMPGITQESVCFTLWDKAKELPEIQEMTIEEICKELGREIKIVK